MANTLNTDDAKLFYRIFRPLLGYVDQTFHVLEKPVKFTADTALDPADCYQVSQKLWEDTSIIDSYLSLHPELSNEEKDILASWKAAISGTFYAERELKNGTVFLKDGTQEAFLVKGITSTLEETFEYWPLPLIVKATLIPFRDVIITDGLMSMYHVYLGSGIKRELKDIYSKAKATGHFFTSMEQKLHPEAAPQPAAGGTQTQDRLIYTLKVYPKKYSSYTFRTYAASDNTTLGALTKKLLKTWELDEKVPCTYEADRKYNAKNRISDLHLVKGENFQLYYGDMWTFQIHVQRVSLYTCARLLRLVNWKGYSDCLAELP